MRNKMKIIALPTWMMTRLFLKFCKTHAWYGKKFSLLDWYLGRKTLCKWFDFVWWLYILILLPWGLIKIITWS